jgi:hypothetical protein
MNKTHFDIIDGFTASLKKNGYESYDPYDLWSTKYGIMARKIFYRSKILSLPLVAPIIIADTYFPQVRKLFIKKKIYPSAISRLIMGYLNLYEITGDEKYLSGAIRSSEIVLNASIKGFSGYCWSYPFDWQNSRGLWEKGTPLITTTPYVFEAFLKLSDVTGEQKYSDIAYSISKFVYNDLNYSEMEDGMLSASYTPFDNSKVINASAYSSYVLSAAYERFNEFKYKERAENLTRFLLKSQNEDGSWLYANDEPYDNFIDNIHTCFVLKNLIKINYILKNDEIVKAIDKGYKYYLVNLIDKKGHPKPFAKLHRLNLIKVDLYDYAESITLGLQLIDKNKEARFIVKRLIDDISKNYISKEGTFTSKVNNIGTKISIPYIRWPQAQLFYAYTSYLKYIYKTSPEFK